MKSNNPWPTIILVVVLFVVAAFNLVAILTQCFTKGGCV